MTSHMGNEFCSKAFFAIEISYKKDPFTKAVHHIESIAPRRGKQQSICSKHFMNWLPPFKSTVHELHSSSWIALHSSWTALTYDGMFSREAKPAAVNIARCFSVGTTVPSASPWSHIPLKKNEWGILLVHMVQWETPTKVCFKQSPSPKCNTDELNLVQH